MSSISVKQVILGIPEEAPREVVEIAPEPVTTSAKEESKKSKETL